jgi:hypothetical protein
MAEYNPSSVVQAAYTTVMDNFMTSGTSSEESVPLEFLAIIKEGIDRHMASSPGVDEVPLAAVDFPMMEAVPEFIPYLTATVTDGGGYSIRSEEEGFEDIDYYIPPKFQRFGEFFDEEPDLDSGRLPLGELSDSSLDLAESTVQSAYNDMTPEQDLDKLSFPQAQFRAKSKQAKTFEWRGNEYTSGYMGGTQSIPADKPQPELSEEDKRTMSAEGRPKVTTKKKTKVGVRSAYGE